MNKLSVYGSIMLVGWVGFVSCQRNQSDSDGKGSTKDMVSKVSKNEQESAQKEFPDVASFVAKDEKIFETSWGDLNKDGKEDVVLIVEKTDPKNILINESLGSDTLNINPRKIMVLFRTEKGFKKIVENVDFMPSENSSESPCLADPIGEGAVSIRKGVFHVSFNYWYSCGSWETSTNTYVFRYQNNKIELIGFDYSSIHRASGEIKEGSFNFMTMEKELKTGGNIADDSEENVKIERSKIVDERLYDLAELTQDWPQRLYE